MHEAQNTVFISYRRKPASFIARAIFMDLREHGYDVFMDVENINAGEFGTIIDNQIKARAHFVIILTTGTVARFDEEKDWLRHEIEYAMAQKRNIVPLLIDGFTFNKTTKRYLTGDLAALPRMNGLPVPHEYFDEAMEKLRTRFLKAPEYVKTEPTPPAEQAEVERKIEEVAAQTPPTKVELSAEDYFNRGVLQHIIGNDDRAIADYEEAIRLNPQYAAAYNNRGLVRQAQGDLKVALADYDEAIRLNPLAPEGYGNRGTARIAQGDFDGGLADYAEMIRTQPGVCRRRLQQSRGCAPSQRRPRRGDCRFRGSNPTQPAVCRSLQQPGECARNTTRL